MTGTWTAKSVLLIIFINVLIMVTVIVFYNGALQSQFESVRLITVNNMAKLNMARKSEAPRGMTGVLQTTITTDSPQQQRNKGLAGGQLRHLVARIHPVVQYESGYHRTPDAKLNNLSLLELFTHYLSLVETLTTTCAKRIRYGNVGDGGWDVCDDVIYQVRAPCLVHSWGINWDFSFDDAMSRKVGCHIHAFDPSMKTKSFNRSNLVHFHSYGLRGERATNQHQYLLHTFDETLTLLGQNGKTIDYFKMDIDGPEWDSLEPMLTKKLFSNVRQFAIEVHIFAHELNRAKFLAAIQVLERLREAGMEMYYSHQNPMGFYQNPLLNKRMTCCHEIYFLNTKYRVGQRD